MAVVFASGKEAVFSIDKLGGKTGVVSVTPLDVSPKVRSAPADYISDAVAPKDDESSGGMNVALIGGGAGALVLLVGGFIFMKIRSDTAQPVTAVPSIKVEDLRSQLAGEI